MSDTPWEVIREAEIMFETLKTNRRYRPTEEQFQNIVDSCAPVDILRLLKTSNSLGTVMHSIVGHGYDDLVRCSLEAVEGENVFSLLMLTSDTSMTAIHYAAYRRDGSGIMEFLLYSVKNETNRVCLLKRTDVGRHTALHYAVAFRNQEVIRVILSSVPPVAAEELINMNNKYNQSCYDIAIQQNNDDTIKNLRRFCSQQVTPDWPIGRFQHQGDPQHQTEYNKMKAELHNVQAENAELRRRIEALESLLQDMNLKLLEQTPGNKKKKMEEHDGRLGRNEKTIEEHNEWLNGQNRELQDHEDRLVKLETPYSVLCPDGGESGEELVECIDTIHPTQETAAIP